MKDSSLVVAFRTHRWNPDIAVLARRLAYFSQGVAFVVLAEETAGVLDVGRFEKCSHGNDFAAFGLPNFPAGRVLWYNADYPLYVLRRAFPQATHFIMSEYDVAVNLDTAAILRDARANGLDLVAHKIMDVANWWHWKDTVEPFFERPMHALLPFLLISARAVDALLKARLEIAARQLPTRHEEWPFCEGFIPSVLARHGMAMAELADYASLEHYDWTGHRHLHDPAVNQLGSICHPVVEAALFIERRIERATAAQILDPSSVLMQGLLFCEPQAFADKLLNRIKTLRSRDALQAYQRLAAQEGWPVPEFSSNIALFKPSVMSSVWPPVSPVSGDLSEAAAGGNNGVINGEFGFHTDFELDPWWQVDLEAKYAVQRVVVYNRLEHAGRCARMSLLSSDDGEHWVLRGAKLDDTVFGGADGHPHVFEFAPPFEARFVRIAMIGEGFLHFDEVEVFGEVLA